jgi:hypothetical protein
MKIELHHHTLEATAGCTVRICERCTQVRGVKADGLFGSSLTCVGLVTCGFECIFQVKQNQKAIPKDFQRKNLEKGTGGGGVSIVIKAVASNEKNVIAIGYCYNAKITFLLLCPLE